MVLFDIFVNVVVCFLCVDYIVAGSDSGRIVILEYIASKNAFEKVYNVLF